MLELGLAEGNTNIQSHCRPLNIPYKSIFLFMYGVHNKTYTVT